MGKNKIRGERENYSGYGSSFGIRGKIAALAALAALYFISKFVSGSPAAKNPARDPYRNSLTVLDVGQASCCLLESEGRFCLIDAGFADGNTDPVTYLYDRGVREIDLMVLTHFHYDHTSEVTRIMKNFDVKALLIPDLSLENTPTNSFYSRLLEGAEEGEYDLFTAKKNLKIDFGEGEIKVLADTYNRGDTNDTSVCLVYTKGDFSLLVTGDAGFRPEEEAAENLPQKGVKYYIAGHHGSSDSGSRYLLDRARPRAAFISCGKDNMYGHPHRETLEAFRDRGIEYYVTREKGNIICSMDTGEIYFE